MKWMLIVFVIGQPNAGLEGLETVGPFETERLCTDAITVVQDNIEMHAQRKTVARCLQTGLDAPADH